MRHRNAGYKLGRNTTHRRAVLRNLVTSVILMDRIETTITKCKASQPLIEKMITLGKRGTVHARRQALSYLMTPESVDRLFAVVAPAMATATAATPGSHAAARARAMRRRWRISSCSAPSRSWTPSARSAKRLAPRSVRRWPSSWRSRIPAARLLKPRPTNKPSSNIPMTRRGGFSCGGFGI